MAHFSETRPQAVPPTGDAAASDGAQSNGGACSAPPETGRAAFDDRAAFHDEVLGALDAVSEHAVVPSNCNVTFMLL